MHSLMATILHNFLENLHQLKPPVTGQVSTPSQVCTMLIYCREPSAEGLRKYDGVRTVQWKWLITGGGALQPMSTNYLDLDKIFDYYT